ncbi:response regulator [Sunxiuqinia elliptica]|uniref:Response regulator receiver domain-containing protein n=1 Tax=Sunxiuqinia elliptica TaxID=655355 RepID=A0A4R6HA34_9BACT|nr:response regulator [Sunxiuqinia elliptica]TDO05222.1 response regulator receiver domain-containing protein [Sunxiuqinia elliptica]TDO64771.1 response regulator receiver domain-containing protein [Sunxiuqinia elliptica]
MLKILVVDDNPINLKFLFYALRHDYDIEMAQDGDEALTKTLAKKYDMIILDLWMPKIDGAEITRQIRSLESNMNRATPIIFCTTSNADADKKRCYGFGANDYLVKPVQVNQLKERLSYYLG